MIALISWTEIPQQSPHASYIEVRDEEEQEEEDAVAASMSLPTVLDF